MSNKNTFYFLGDFLDIKRGPGLPSEFYSEKGNLIRLTLGNFNYPNGGFKQNDSKDNIFYVGNVKKEFILKKGDLITPLTEQTEGLLGETAWIPEDNKYIQNGDIGLVIPIEEKMNKKYCYYLLSSPLIKKQLSAGAQQTKIRHTSPEKIKKCIAPIPCIETQIKIGNNLSSIDDQIMRNNVMVQKLPFRRCHRVYCRKDRRRKIYKGFCRKDEDSIFVYTRSLWN